MDSEYISFLNLFNKIHSKSYILTRNPAPMDFSMRRCGIGEVELNQALEKGISHRDQIKVICRKSIINFYEIQS
jgi:hypothetical protein